METVVGMRAEIHRMHLLRVTPFLLLKPLSHCFRTMRGAVTMFLARHGNMHAEETVNGNNGIMVESLFNLGR